MISSYEKIIQRTSMQDKLILEFDSSRMKNVICFFSCWCDCIALPKIYQSGVLLMAMSYGLPVVCIKFTSTMREIIRDGEKWNSFPDGQPQELADKINLLLSSPELPENWNCKLWRIVRKSTIENDSGFFLFLTFLTWNCADWFPWNSCEVWRIRNIYRTFGQRPRWNTDTRYLLW